MRCMVSRLALVAVLSVALFGLLGSHGRATGGETVLVGLGSRNVSSGDRFQIDLTVNATLPIRGLQFALSYDPVVLRCDGIAEGRFFSDWAGAHGAATLVLPAQADLSTTGQIASTGIVILGGEQSGPNGAGVVFTLSFTALKRGAAPLLLSDVRAVDASGNVIAAVQVQSGQAIVDQGQATPGGVAVAPVPKPLGGTLTLASAPPPDWDVNFDHWCDIGDVGRLGLK
ncbi:MAG: cohesin domain-containing protein [Anaerolineae bacterium]